MPSSEQQSPTDIQMDIELADLSWDEFSRKSTSEANTNEKAYEVRRVQNINGFKLDIVVPPFPSQFDGETVATSMHATMFEILSEAGFFGAEHIESRYAANSATVLYNDDAYGFQLEFAPRGQLRISRPGSSLERFHEWYKRLMPTVVNTVNKLATALYTTQSERFKLLSVDFSFQVVAFDFAPETVKGKQIRNTEIVRRLLAAAVLPTGQIGHEHGSETGRVDVRYSNMVLSKNEYHRELYGVSAPANRNWTSLVFDLDYIGETFVSAKNERSEFRGVDFLSWPARPYVSFFRDRGIEGFLHSLLGETSYETSSGSLP